MITTFSFTNMKASIKAISNICRHFGGPVGYHQNKDGVFTCLWHNWKYSCKDGSCISHPGLPLRQYALKIDENKNSGSMENTNSIRPSEVLPRSKRWKASNGPSTTAPNSDTPITNAFVGLSHRFQHSWRAA
jgi:nitrite reductase/ring-hydroxylating ferredoxin subunit